MNSHIKYLLRIADSNLILGQRLAEWCGHGPVVEEDIALTNISLDLIGQAKILYNHISQVEGAGKSEDDYAFLRDELDFYNFLLSEQENGDFGVTIARQYFFSQFFELYYTQLLNSKDEELAGFAAKSLKECQYHVKHTREWMLRLGDGTEESHERIQAAVNQLWEFTGEMFAMDEVDQEMIDAGIGVDLAPIHEEWMSLVRATFDEATIAMPAEDTYMHLGGKQGRHTERLGYLLAEMQFLQRAYPGAEW